MSANRRELVLRELEVTGAGFLDSIEGLTPAQWSWAPGPDRWSAALTAEHVTVVLRGISRLLSTKLLSMPIAPREEDPHATDDQIVKLMFDRGRSVQAPETVQPKGRWGTPAECVDAFRQAQDEMTAWYEGVTEDLRLFGAPHPLLGTLDGVQWLLFVAAHTERHTRQIHETRAAAGFPPAD